MSSHKCFFICLHVKGELFFFPLYFLPRFFVFTFLAFPPKTQSTFLCQVQPSKCQHFPKKCPFPKWFSAPKTSVELFEPVPFILAEKNTNKMPIYISMQMTSCSPVITKTWNILVHGKRKEMVCVPVFQGWQKGEPIQKRPYKPEQKRAFIFFQIEKSLHINCRTEVQFLCQYQMNPACQCRRKFTGQYKRAFLWITLQKKGA